MGFNLVPCHSTLRPGSGHALVEGFMKHSLRKMEINTRITRNSEDKRMRKLFAFNMVTLDGFFEGPNQDISWHNVDDEFNEFAIEQTSTLAVCRRGITE